jgi:hypothetical protein
VAEGGADRERILPTGASDSLDGNHGGNRLSFPRPV